MPATSVAEREAHSRWERTNYRTVGNKQKQANTRKTSWDPVKFHTTAQSAWTHCWLYSLWLHSSLFSFLPSKISAQLRCLVLEDLRHGIGSVSYCYERTWCLTTFKRFSVDWAFQKYSFCNGSSPTELFPAIMFTPWLSHCIVAFPCLDWEQTKCQTFSFLLYLALMCWAAGLGRHAQLLAEQLGVLTNPVGMPKIL